MRGHRRGARQLGSPSSLLSEVNTPGLRIPLRLCGEGVSGTGVLSPAPTASAGKA